MIFPEWLCFIVAGIYTIFPRPFTSQVVACIHSGGFIEGTLEITPLHYLIPLYHSNQPRTNPAPNFPFVTMPQGSGNWPWPRPFSTCYGWWRLSLGNPCDFLWCLCLKIHPDREVGEVGWGMGAIPAIVSGQSLRSRSLRSGHQPYGVGSGSAWTWCVYYDHTKKVCRSFGAVK